MRCAPHFAREFRDLGRVQIIRWSERPQAQCEKFVGGEGVGGVEAEIARQLARLAMAERLQQAGGAHQDGTIAAEQEIHDLLLAGLEHAGAGDSHRDA